jgi:Archaeal enzymes of ATP-grasp superfamily
MDDPGDLIAPSLVAGFDGWVDSGAAATTALAGLASDARVVATFEADSLYDYRARRPTLDIVDGCLTEIVWPRLVLRGIRVGERDLLILTGAEPDYHWREFSDAVTELARQLGVAEWISLGAIPAAVPHTRPVPIMGTASEPGLLRGGIKPGPAGRLRVPAALISVLELEQARAGIPAVGYFAQVPHYVSGPYPTAALELLRSLGRHLGLDLSEGTLPDESRELRTHLDSLAAGDATTRAYVERLESMVDEERLPSGDDLIEEIERFLRDGGTTGGSR